MNNNQINERIQMRVDDVTSRAAQLLEKIAVTEEWGEVLVDGCQEHGNAFTAFLPAPFVTMHRPGQLLELNDRAFVLQGRNEEDEVETLVLRNGWEEIRATANRNLGVDELLTWGDDDLRLVPSDRYAFIRTYDGCFVFDRKVLDPDYQN